MPLDRYGVLVGTLAGHHRDTPDDQGRWFHVNLEVDAPAGRYRCAVDVDSKQSAVGVAWKTVVVDPAQLRLPPGLAPGYHDLEPNAGSGAVDYIRDALFNGARGCFFVRAPDGWLARLVDLLFPRRPWTFGSNLEAATALESILAVGRRTLVFGEPFTSGRGQHNIHQNQGDPPGSQWWDENGIWQDGATMAERPDGRLDVFLNKFSSQADRTDDAGHPV